MMTKTMNKLVIPTILLATVMVAGMFAFMPVNQASTVHATIIIPELNAQDRTITYYQLFGGGADIDLDELALVLQSEDAYSGELSITIFGRESDGDTECAATFTVDADTNNDGASDVIISTVTSVDGALTMFDDDTDPLPVGTDQIFLNSANIGDDADSHCAVSVVLLLEGTQT